MESWYNGIVFFALTTTIMACDTNGLIIRGTPRSIRYITKSVRELLHFPSNRNALNTRQRDRSSSIRSVAQFAWKFPDDRYVWVDRFETHENVNAPRRCGKFIPSRAYVHSQTHQILFRLLFCKRANHWNRPLKTCCLLQNMPKSGNSYWCSSVISWTPQSIKSVSFVDNCCKKNRSARRWRELVTHDITNVD